MHSGKQWTSSSFVLGDDNNRALFDLLICFHLCVCVCPCVREREIHLLGGRCNSKEQNKLCTVTTIGFPLFMSFFYYYF